MPKKRKTNKFLDINFNLIGNEEPEVEKKFAFWAFIIMLAIAVLYVISFYL